VNAPLEPAHSPFGGSVAARVLNCPASVRLIEKVPAHLRKPPSAYAARGTALHTAMARLVENECSFDDLIGATIDNYTLTADDVENALKPAYSFVDALLTPGSEYYLEARVTFPAIADAYGRCDLITRNGNVITVADLKFGQGVKVLAIYPGDDTDTLNSQLMFYAAAARRTFPKFFAGATDIVLTIVQPQSIDIDAESISTVQVEPAELDAFVELYRAAAEEALGPAPRLQRGAHCRFCPAKPICPAHTGPLFDLAMFDVPAPGKKDEQYLRALAEGMNLVDAIKEISKALHDQAKQALENGDPVPGFALTEGRAVRAWADETTAAPSLLKLGLSRDDVLVEALRSPKQVEVRAKARGVRIPKELIESHPSGVSLVRSENAHAPILGRSERAKEWPG
jgi:Protein of unknown function (DUF2800)